MPNFIKFSSKPCEGKECAERQTWAGKYKVPWFFQQTLTKNVKCVWIGLWVVFMSRLTSKYKYILNLIWDWKYWEQSYLYLAKKLGVSNNFSQPNFPQTMSSVVCSPCLNSSCITVLVDSDTLKVEFCWGYAGVMIGIKWYLSGTLTWKLVYKKLDHSGVTKLFFCLINIQSTPDFPGWPLAG